MASPWASTRAISLFSVDLLQACYAVPSLEVFRSMAGDRWAKYQVVAVDEAQFFPDLFHICSSTADGEGKLWVLAGLDGDFMRQRFGQVGFGMEGADTSLGEVCGSVLECLCLDS